MYSQQFVILNIEYIDFATVHVVDVLKLEMFWWQCEYGYSGMKYSLFILGFLIQGELFQIIQIYKVYLQSLQSIQSECSRQILQQYIPLFGWLISVVILIRNMQYEFTTEAGDWYCKYTPQLNLPLYGFALQIVYILIRNCDSPILFPVAFVDFSDESSNQQDFSHRCLFLEGLVLTQECGLRTTQVELR